MDRLGVGSVHGRFQPFHNGHLDYLMQAFERAEFINIGLTQMMRPRESDMDTGRNSTNSNPLAYWERAQLIETGLMEAGVSPERFKFIPFPIEQPDRLPEFLDLRVVCFTTIVSDWNDQKIRILTDLGYRVIVLATSLPDNNRVTAGSEIRSLLRAGDRGWSRYVPPAVAELLAREFRDRF